MAAVMARLAGNKQTSTRNNQSPETTLLRNGHIYCGHCGWALRARNAPPHDPTRSAWYCCHSRSMKSTDCPQTGIAASIIDGSVWEQVCEILSHPEIIANEVARHRQDGGVERELAAAETRMAALVTKHQQGTKRLLLVDDDTAERLIADLKALVTRYERRNRTGTICRHAWRIRQRRRPAMQSLADWAATVAANLDGLSYARRRDALDALGVRVDVWRIDAVDTEGQPLPRWSLTIAPQAVTPHSDILDRTSRGPSR